VGRAHHKNGDGTLVGEPFVVLGKADIRREGGGAIAFVFLALGLVTDVASDNTFDIALGLWVRLQIETPGGVGRAAPIAGNNRELVGFAADADVDQWCDPFLAGLTPRVVIMTIGNLARTLVAVVLRLTARKNKMSR
jgi:hypothetical protein